MNSIGALRRDFVILLAIFVVLLVMASAGCSSNASGAEHGRQLVQQYQCGTCHQIPGVNAANGTVAVTLESFGVRSYIAGHVPNTDESLVRWLMNPAALVPGTLMPNMSVTRDDARDIAAYLRQLR